MQERKVVVMALAGTATLVIADRAFRNEFPKPRIILGLALAFLFLGILVEVAGDVAAAFALLILVGTVLAIGPGVWQKATKAIGG